MEPYKRFVERILNQGQHVLGQLLRRSEQGTNKRAYVVAIVVVFIILLPYTLFVRPPQDFPAGALIEVREGMSLSEIAELLRSEGVVRSSFVLRATIFLTGNQRNVHFGDYLFNKPRNVFYVARAIAKGEYGLEPMRIRVSEGATVREMAELFSEKFQRFNTERFIRAAEPMEGYLFPDTYFFLPNANDDLVLRTLRQSFDAHIATLEEEIAEFGKPLEDVVIMASLLEREAHNARDRRLIAGVLWRRLSQNMLLQVDAAFLYSLGKGTFDLTKADLSDSDDPYNTYVHKGLPPGPIGSPSLDAILAAITPIDNGYIFYLADKNGITHYCETYACHL
ncbi:endolytic transglycosylase MltG, partial [Candidatus Parcubacteria bacterium]